MSAADAHAYAVTFRTLLVCTSRYCAISLTQLCVSVLSSAAVFSFRFQILAAYVLAYVVCVYERLFS